MNLLNWEIRLLETGVFTTFIYVLVFKKDKINYGVASILITGIAIILQNKYQQLTLKKQEENNNEKKESTRP